MSNRMAALSREDTTPIARVLCSNAANIGKRKIWTQSEFRPGKILLWAIAPENVYIATLVNQSRRRPNIVQVWLTSVKRRRCSNEAKTRNPLKSVGVPQTRQPISAVSAPYCEDIWRRLLLFNKFFPIVDTCLSCEDIAQQNCAMVPRWRILAVFFASCIFSEPREAHFTPAF